MSLYIGTSSNTVVDLIANKDNENTVKQLLKKHYLPVIGAIKLVARGSRPQVSGIVQQNGIWKLSDGVFQGWVVADGSWFLKSDFGDAFNAFGTTYGGDFSSFGIPNLLNFYKIDNSRIATSSAENPCQTILSQHQHGIHKDYTFNYSGKIENCISAVTTAATNESGVIITKEQALVAGGGYTCAQRVGDGVTLDQLFDPNSGYYDVLPAFHNGSGSYKIFTSPLTINPQADFSLVNTNFSGTESPDCFPAHLTLIPMIYIGANI